MRALPAILFLTAAFPACALAGSLEFSKPPARDWSAVAFGEDGSRGVTTDELSEQNARSTAYVNCNAKCDFVVPYTKGVCVAVASSARGPYRYVNGFSYEGTDHAETVTMARCRNRGIVGCRIVFSNCG